MSAGVPENFPCTPQERRLIEVLREFRINPDSVINMLLGPLLQQAQARLQPTATEVQPTATEVGGSSSLGTFVRALGQFFRFLIRSVFGSALLLILLAAFIATMVLVIALFIVPKEDMTALAAAAFAVTGLMTTIPFQMGAVLDPTGDKGDRLTLTTSGELMSIGAVFFLCATVTKACGVRGPAFLGLLAAGDRQIIYGLLSPAANTAFLLGALLTAIGIVLFARVLMWRHLYLYWTDPDQGST